MSYQNLSDALKLRVDAHILDYFRDNDRARNGTFLDGFRNMVLETSKQPGFTADTAYDKVLADLRDGLSVGAERLASVESKNIKYDMSLVGTILRLDLKPIVISEVTSLDYKPDTFYHHTIENELKIIRGNTGSDLTVKGQKPQESVHFLNQRASDMHSENLDRLYGSQVAAAVKTLKTGLNDYREAQLLNTAIATINNTNIVEYNAPWNDNGVGEAKDAVSKALRQKGIVLADAKIDEIVQAAVPIAAHDGKGRESWSKN